MIITTLSPSLCPAKNMTPEQKKRAALEVLSRKKTTTCLADENSTSRKFIRQQGCKAQAALDTVFNVNEAGNNDVIYNLPVTKTWRLFMDSGELAWRLLKKLVKSRFPRYRTLIND